MHIAHLHLLPSDCSKEWTTNIANEQKFEHGIAENYKNILPIARTSVTMKCLLMHHTTYCTYKISIHQTSVI